MITYNVLIGDQNAGLDIGESLMGSLDLRAAGMLGNQQALTPSSKILSKSSYGSHDL